MYIYQLLLEAWQKTESGQRGGKEWSNARGPTYMYICSLDLFRWVHVEGDNLDIRPVTWRTDDVSDYYFRLLNEHWKADMASQQKIQSVSWILGLISEMTTTGVPQHLLLACASWLRGSIILFKKGQNAVQNWRHPDSSLLYKPFI